MTDTVWVLGDQLNRRIGPLADRAPGEVRVLLVESRAKLASRRWHVQRAHLVLSAMAHFAAELEAEGFEVDHRRAGSLTDGLREHRQRFGPGRVVAMEPMSWNGRTLLERLEVDLVANDQFLCPAPEFAAWADGRERFRMEDFYRWQRQRLDILMDGDEPAGGRWNFDDQNRDGRRATAGPGRRSAASSWTIWIAGSWSACPPTPGVTPRTAPGP